MTIGVAEGQATVEMEYRTTETPCPLCLITFSLDDERPKKGTIRWEITPSLRLKIATAVRFECPNGHSSEDDPDLLRAFPRRRI